MAKKTKKKSIIENAPEEKISKQQQHTHTHEHNDETHEAIHDIIDMLTHTLHHINEKYSDVLSVDDVAFAIYMIGNITILQSGKGIEEIVELYDESLAQAMSMKDGEFADEEIADPDDEDAPRLAKPKLIPNKKN